MLSIYVGRLGEIFVEGQTGESVVSSRIVRLSFGGAGVDRTSDIVDLSCGGPPVIGEVKVGYFSRPVQATAFARMVKNGRARPGVIYFLESPITGRIGTSKRIKKILDEAEFSFVYFKGPWWEPMFT